MTKGEIFDWIGIDANRGPSGDIKMSLTCHLAHGLVDNLMELLTHSSLTLSEAPRVQQAKNIMMNWVSLEAWLNRYELIILISIKEVSFGKYVYGVVCLNWSWDMIEIGCDLSYLERKEENGVWLQV